MTRATTASSTNAVARAAPANAAALANDDARREWALIQAVQRGDMDAFESLVIEHQTRVYQLAYRMLGGEPEAQDAAQDAFLNALTRIESFNPQYRFKTWVMAIANHICIDRLRRRRIEPNSFSDQVTVMDDGEVEFDAASDEPQPDVVTAQRERQRTVQTMLSTLPAEDRAMLVMFYWGDLSYEEIAAATGASLSAVKSRLFRARRALAELPQAAQLIAEGQE